MEKFFTTNYNRNMNINDSCINYWDGKYKIPKNKDNRTDLEKEYDSLSRSSKSALGYVRNNYKKEILNFKGFEDAILDSEGEIIRPSDQDWYLSQNSKEQSAIINNIKDCDPILEKAFQKGNELSEKYLTQSRINKVKNTGVVFNNKDYKIGNYEELTSEQLDYFMNDLQNSGTIFTVYRKKKGRYYNVYDPKNDWFTTISNISEAKNFSQVSLGFGSNERRGIAIDVDNPPSNKNVWDCINHSINVIRVMLGDYNWNPSYISLNTDKNSYQIIILFSDIVRFVDNIEENDIYQEVFLDDMKTTYTWVRKAITSCVSGADVFYTGYNCKNFRYTQHHSHYDSRYKDLNRRGYTPYIEKHSFFNYFLVRLFQYYRENNLYIPLAVYRVLDIEEEYTPTDFKNLKEIEDNSNNTDKEIRREINKKIRNYTASLLVNKGNYINLRWEGNIINHPYYNQFTSNLKDISRLIGISFEEVLDRFLFNTKYPIEGLKYIKEGRIVRNTPSFLCSGYLQRELHKDRLLSLDDSVIGIQVRESLMRAYEWYFIGFGSNYSTIEDSADIHASAVGGWASTSDYAREEIENQIKQYGNSISYYSHHKGIRPSANGSKYTLEQRIRGNETVQFNAYIRRINTKLEFHDKRFIEVNGSSRYKTDVKNQNTKDLIKNIFLYEGSEFIYNFSNRKNNEYIKSKLYDLYVNKENILTLAELENIDISDYEPYIQILDNLYESKEIVEESNNIIIDINDREYSTSYLDKLSIFKNRNYISLDSQNKVLTGNDFYKNMILANLKPYSLELSDITYYYRTIDKFKQNQEIFSEVA